jgi:hypothetical protein
MHQFARHRGGQRDPGCSDSLTRAAGTIRDVLDDLARLPVTVSRAEHSAVILDRLAAELGNTPPCCGRQRREVKAGRAPLVPSVCMRVLINTGTSDDLGRRVTELEAEIPVGSE